MGTTRRLLLGAALVCVAAGASCVRRPAAPVAPAAPAAPTAPAAKAPVGLDYLAAVRKLGFSQEVLRRIAKAADAPLEPITNFDGELTGVQAAAPTGKVGELVASLGAELQPKGYLVFQSDQGVGDRPDRIGVVKGTDQYDILRAVATDGANYNVSNGDVIAKLKEWDARYQLHITGAGGDWVEARFGKPPSDMDAFAAEVNQFCPDVVSQGTGTVADLAADMRKTGKLYLWWD